VKQYGWAIQYIKNPDKEVLEYLKNKKSYLIARVISKLF